MVKIEGTLEEVRVLLRSLDRVATGAELEAAGFMLEDTGKKTKSRKRRKDPKMKKALQQANQKLRNKNGSIKKGKSQSDIMKMAHKLRRKMK